MILLLLLCIDGINLYNVYVTVNVNRAVNVRNIDLCNFTVSTQGITEQIH
jgi:hypothetical protein